MNISFFVLTCLPAVLVVVGCWFGYLILRFFSKQMGKKMGIKKINKDFYFRDIPCFNNINLAYWLLYNFSNEDKNNLNNGLIGAYLLIWYKKGYININKNKNNYIIDLLDKDWEKNQFEGNLYEFLKNVAGNNNYLEKNEIERYCRVGVGKYEFERLFNNLVDDVKIQLEKDNYITTNQSNDHVSYKNNSKINLSPELINEYQNLIGLKKFLSDFSNIEDKKHVQVHLWENYLIFANLLGIADKVSKQFKEIYPDYNDVGSMFSLSYDNNLLGVIGTLYNTSKLYLLSSVVTCVLVLLIFFLLKIEMNLMIITIFIIISLLVFFSWLMLKPYFDNKKVKELDGRTYATVIEVSRKKSRGYDNESYYSVMYEYVVNGKKYTGFYSEDNFAPRIGKKVKIYYNLLKPEKNQLKKEHNEWLNQFILIISIVLFCFLLVFLGLPYLEG